MPNFRITAPDGKMYDVTAPEGATQEEVLAYVKSQHEAPAQKSDYGDIVGSPGQQFLAGVGRGMVNTGRGIGQALGLVDQADIDEAKRLDQPLMNTGYGKAGDIAGTIASTLPAMAIPGANTILGGAAVGGGLGALQPVGSDESRLTNAGMGAAGGAIGSAAGRAISGILNPTLAPGARELMDQGVTLTPGQMLGGGFKSAEEKLSSIPLIGDMINSGQRNAQDSFNRIALARALHGTGQTPSGEIGREGLADASAKLSAAYDDLLPRLRFQADPEFISDMTNIRSMASNLPPAQAQQFDRIMRDQVLGKMTDHGLMNGESLKAVQSDLGRLAAGYRGDSAFDNRQLGDALAAVQDSIRQNIVRANPQEAEALNGINQGYANYVRLRDAASRQGSKEGVFSPAQLAAAVRSSDKSVGKGNYARGQALMQDLADQGQAVIGNKYPDSGTVGRALLTAAIGGGAAVNPAAAAGAGLASLLYTRPGQRLAQALIAQRPELLRQLGRGADALSPTLGYGGTIGALENQQ